MEPFIGEIKICPFNFAPKGWLLCNGALLQISANQALYALLGVTYGGDGKTTFALPDLRGRTPVHRNNSEPTQPPLALGKLAGSETVQLKATDMALHTHAFKVSSVPGKRLNAGIANSSVLAAANLYGPANPLLQMSATTCSTVGGTPHNNMQPSLVLNFIIATVGLWPARD